MDPDTHGKQFVPYTYNPWAKWVFICFLAVVYLMPVFYVFSKRNVAETSARSPVTTTLCILFIMIDSIFNTIIFSIDTNSTAKAELKCLLGVWVTMLVMIPILLTMYLRIYRVKRVFELYEKFLQKTAKRQGSIYSTIGMSTSYAKLRSNSPVRVTQNSIDHSDLRNTDTSKPEGLHPITSSHLSQSGERSRFQSENYDKQSLLKSSNMTGDDASSGEIRTQSAHNSFQPPATPANESSNDKKSSNLNASENNDSTNGE